MHAGASMGGMPRGGCPQEDLMHAGASMGGMPRGGCPQEDLLHAGASMGGMPRGGCPQEDLLHAAASMGGMPRGGCPQEDLLHAGARWCWVVLGWSILANVTMPSVASTVEQWWRCGALVVVCFCAGCCDLAL